MKLKLDENLPDSLLATLKALGYDVDNAMAEGLVRHDFGRPSGTYFVLTPNPALKRRIVKCPFGTIQPFRFKLTDQAARWNRKILSNQEARGAQKLNPCAPFVPFRGHLHLFKLSSILRSPQYLRPIAAFNLDGHGP
jgi:hypothetical protein